jgi:hypothetical protein
MRNSIRLSCGTSVFCSATPRWTSSAHRTASTTLANSTRAPSPVFLSDFGIEKRLSESFQLRQRAFFVDPY